MTDLPSPCGRSAGPFFLFSDPRSLIPDPYLGVDGCLCRPSVQAVTETRTPRQARPGWLGSEILAM
jgi:hypothetical protein